MKLMWQKGKASFIIGGQFGSEGKGAAAAYVAKRCYEAGAQFDIITTNAGAQAGHTSIHNGKKRICRFLPTAALIARDMGYRPTVYLNAGSVIEPEGLLAEINEHLGSDVPVLVHPNAAIIDPVDVANECREESSATQIASTRKGVGSAIARKVLRSAPLAQNIPALRGLICRVDMNEQLQRGQTALVEVPQGLDLSLNGRFYPYTTSRDCTIEQAMNDAGIHPHFYGAALLVVRTYPIRVGNLGGHYSGGAWPSQDEISWESIGKPPELTTVTQRPRRLFTFSEMQWEHAMGRVRPDYVMLTFCDYCSPGELPLCWGMLLRRSFTRSYGARCSVRSVYFASGPTTDDVVEEETFNE